MNKREYKAEIRCVQDRHDSLKLTFGQAEQVYLFEQERDRHAEEYFSFWEEMDFQMDVFRNILTAEQWTVYEPGWQEHIAFHIQTLIEGDQQALKQIAYCQAILDYYQQDFIPEVKRSGLWSRVRDESSLQPKADYLRAETTLFWQKRKKSILIHHYRHSRQYQPLSLQKALLKHQIHTLLPMVPVENIDEPTNAATRFVSDRLPIWYFKLPAYAKLWEDHLLRMQQLREQHFGKPSDRQGWHVTISTDPEKQQADFLMSLLLMNNQ
jgi:hypothetical protein